MCHFYIDKFKIYFAFNYISKTFTVPCENLKTVSFTSSGMKQNLLLFSLSKFAVKLNYWIALGSASRACSLLKSIAIIL